MRDMSTLALREDFYINQPCYPTGDETAAKLARVQWLKLFHQHVPFWDVLDIGCHDGFVTRWLLDDPRTKRLIGIDLSLNALQAARMLAKRKMYGDKAKYLQKRYTEVPGHWKFRVVIAFELIEHLDDADARDLVRRMTDHVTENGQCFLTTPDIDGPFGRDNPDPSHINLFDLARLKRLIDEESGSESVVQLAHGNLYAHWGKPE